MQRLLCSSLLLLSHAAGSAAQSSAPSNPIQVASAEFLGNVTSDNTPWSRDLGFQGQIGDCFINTFGDDFRCKSQNPQEHCTFDITARNSCTKPVSPTSYQDYFVSPEGAPQPCVGPISPETTATPMGITNVVQTGANKGILYVLPGAVSPTTKDPGFQGAGYAIVTTTDDCSNITIDRPDFSLWNGDLASTGIEIETTSGTQTSTQQYNESFFGDHSIVLAQDGYIYLFGKMPDHHAVALARVHPSMATSISAYEYWNGKTFQTDRIQNPIVAAAVLNDTAQGSAFWSPHYRTYIYLSTAVTTVTARTAVNPWGPWTEAKDVWSLQQMPYQYAPINGSFGSLYSPAVQPKWASSNGTDFVIWVTYAVTAADGGHEVTTAVRVTFEASTDSTSSANSTSGSGTPSTTNGASASARDAAFSVIFGATIAAISCILTF